MELGPHSGPAPQASREHTSSTRIPEAIQAKQDGIPPGKRIWQLAGLALAASIAAVTLIGVDHQPAETTAPVAYSVPAISTAGDTTNPAVSADGGTIQTTFHHPFYDQTQAAFVDAKDLRPGDVLQTPTGTAQVTDVRLYHADTTTYDLTVGDLHTYYVEAGDTPVLVHNCGGTATVHAYEGEEGPHFNIEIRSQSGAYEHAHANEISGILRPMRFKGIPDGMKHVGSTTFDLENANQAIRYARQSYRGSAGQGAYDFKVNSCLVYCSRVADAGGGGMPTGTGALFKWAREKSDTGADAASRRRLRGT
ncbi:polymorphic toxin-type HINT domain-containing protein [Kitasatospora sp. NPDC001539]|uniref:polymorphic toxin-type HINT domain-containing protein n=1 Tax=Kitasatospora sp. NPDC001539 TaxID=3154384 RepID=UPI00332F078A